CKDVTITSQGDVSDLSRCSTIKGDVTIDKSVGGELNIQGVKKIEGSLIAQGATNLTSFTANDLKEIGDAFELTSLTQMTNLEMSALEKVGSIDFEALPALQTLGFTKGVKSAGKLLITNTGLTSLSGISLETVGSIDVNNNNKLAEINVNEIKNITGLASFSANNKRLEIIFPNLRSAQNMTFRNLSRVELPSLKKTDGLLGFYSNSFSSLSAPNLTSTGDLVFTSNPQLTNMSLPKLTKVDGVYQVANNTKLHSITGVNSLETVNAIDFAGNFTKVDLPKLKSVAGDFNLQATNNVGCDKIKKEINDDVAGTVTCKEHISDPKTSSGNKGASKTSSASAADATDADSGAASTNAASFGLVAALVAAMVL
ncbi:hypothetical protein KEM52_001766, partial [Ascosphaera acerosa]